MGLLEAAPLVGRRVPTASGLRFFIHSCFSPRLSVREKEENPRAGHRPTPMRGAARVAAAQRSDAARGHHHHAGPDQLRLGQIEFVPLRDGKCRRAVTTDGRSRTG